jgi:hypothetical protein
MIVVPSDANKMKIDLKVECLDKSHSTVWVSFGADLPDYHDDHSPFLGDIAADRVPLDVRAYTMEAKG